MRSEYKGTYLWFRQGYHGGFRLLRQGDPGEGEVIADVIDELFAAALQIPAVAAGKKRAKSPPAPKPESDADRAEDDPGDDRYEDERDRFIRPDQVTVYFPLHFPAYDSQALMPGNTLAATSYNGDEGMQRRVDGRELAALLIRDEIGRAVEPDAPGAGETHAWTLSGLTDDEVVRVRERLWPLREFYLSERKARAAARKEEKQRRAAAAGATMWADF